MVPGIGVIVSLVFAAVFLVGSLVVAIFSQWLGAVGYTAAIYVLFAITAVSSWCVQVRKNDAWEELGRVLINLER